MKQAIHIFRKDVRRLWPLALVVVCLFALYGMSPNDNGASGILAALAVIACWTVGAHLIHEDALAEEAPFWITRPYNRMSLLAAKALFLFVFEFLPLLASGVLLEARNGVDVFATAGNLLAFDIEISLWLILPILAIGAITNNIRAFAGSVIAVFFCSFAAARWTVTHLDMGSSIPLPDGTNILAWAPGILAAFCVIGLQYALRKTQWSRVALAVAVIASCFLMERNSVALASNHIVNPPDFDLRQLKISFDETTPPSYDAGLEIIRGICATVALKVQGLPAGTELREYGRATADTSSAPAGTRTIVRADVLLTSDGYREQMCIPGPYTTSPETLRASLNFEVVAFTDIATIPARPGTFTAGKYGRCEILTPFPENTQLRCVLEDPLIGTISAGLEYPGYRSYANGFNRDGSGPFRLSPVSQEKFDGSPYTSPRGWPFEEAFAQPDAHFVLRTERVVGTIQRELLYKNFVLPQRPQ